jgi:hypothetical protein
LSVVVANLTLNGLSPTSWPYVTVLPPPETTPLLTLSCAAGTPRLAAAIASSATFASAAARRTSGPPCEIDELPPVLPVFGDGSLPPVSNAMWRIWLTSTSSSSAAIIIRPVVAPCPSSMRPELSDTVLSACTIRNESTAFGSAGPGLANGSMPAADALPAVPATVRPTISAPPPLTNVLRENSRSCRKPVITCLPLPSRRRPA